MRLLDVNGLRKKGLDYSDTHIDRMIRDGRLPKPIRWGGSNSKKYWDEGEIDALIAAKLAQRDEAA